MDQISNFLQTVSRELGEMSSQMNSTTWIALSFVTVLAGWYFLRGNVIKST